MKIIFCTASCGFLGSGTESVSIGHWVDRSMVVFALRVANRHSSQRNETQLTRPDPLVHAYQFDCTFSASYSQSVVFLLRRLLSDSQQKNCTGQLNCFLYKDGRPTAHKYNISTTTDWATTSATSSSSTSSINFMAFYCSKIQEERRVSASPSLYNIVQIDRLPYPVDFETMQNICNAFVRNNTSQDTVSQCGQWRFCHPSNNREDQKMSTSCQAVHQQ